MERRERAERERLAKIKPSRSASAGWRRSAWPPNRNASRSSSGSRPSSGRVGEQQRLAAEQRRVSEQQEQVAKQQAAARNSAKASSKRLWRPQHGWQPALAGADPILISYGSPRTAELKWKGTPDRRQRRDPGQPCLGQVVMRTGWTGFGMLLVIDHGRGYMSLYGHKPVAAAPGGPERVEQGEPVAPGRRQRRAGALRPLLRDPLSGAKPSTPPSGWPDADTPAPSESETILPCAGFLHGEGHSQPRTCTTPLP